jgi:RNA polymerase sigma factor (sigma-70 family)
MDVKDREALCKRYLPLVYRLCRVSLSKGTPAWVREDVVQEGLVGLWEAVLRFSETKLPVAQFGAYARFWIRRHINRELDRVNAKQRRESTGSRFEEELRHESVDSPMDQEDDLALAVATLPQLERDLLSGWYGLDGQKPSSVLALAARFGLTPSKVRTRIERAARILVERMESRR